MVISNTKNTFGLKSPLFHIARDILIYSLFILSAVNILGFFLHIDLLWGIIIPGILLGLFIPFQALKTGELISFKRFIIAITTMSLFYSVGQILLWWHRHVHFYRVFYEDAALLFLGSLIIGLFLFLLVVAFKRLFRL